MYTNKIKYAYYIYTCIYIYLIYIYIHITAIHNYIYTSYDPKSTKRITSHHRDINTFFPSVSLLQYCSTAS